MLPEQLGPYRIDKVLGRGGMGTVYAGIDRESGNRAAIKILLAALGDDATVRQRFALEIETLKQLRHPHIVELFGYGQQDGHLFYAMELVEGSSLQDQLQAGQRFDWRRVIQIGIQVCAALKHAHDRGVIHRDLKPANLLMDVDGQTKLSDFGIAKMFGSASMTADGGVLGTADYMSPEQAEGIPASTRSDMYSLGSVLYALLARRPPHVARSLPEMIHRLRYENPRPIGELAPEVPRELENILERLLDKDPQKRIATPLALSNRLKELELGGQTNIDHIPSIDSSSPDGTFISTGDQVQGQLTSLPGVADLGITAPLTGEESDSMLASPADAPRRQGFATLEHSFPENHSASGFSAAPPRPDHFIPVDEEQRQRALRSEPLPDEPTSHWPLVVPLSVIIMVLALGSWLALRPISADALHDRIRAVAEEGEPQQLLDVQGDIQQFLERFPADPRAPEVAELQEEIQLHRLQRRFDLRTRRLGRDRPLSPTEQVYVKAMQTALTDREAAIVQLQSLIDVFGQQENANEATRLCLELARKQLAKYQADLEETSKQHMAIIEKCLEDAERIHTRDPATSQAIWRGIIQLYGEKPWAEQAVDRARMALAP